MSEKEFKTITLKYPIPVPKDGGGMVDVSTLRVGRLKAKHLRALPPSFTERKGEVEPAELIPLIAALVELPECSIDEMDISDLEVFAGELENFLEGSLVTGKK
jgi:hypothetical protein